jgi:hypothetical protein
MPPGIAKLPRDPRGYPIFFTAAKKADGSPDFRVADPFKRTVAMLERRCGLCGEPLGYWIVFIGGPRALENRSFGDPPMHEDCARYAVKVCPYLAIKETDRTYSGPEAAFSKEVTIPEKPAVVLLWKCRGYDVERPARGASPADFVFIAWPATEIADYRPEPRKGATNADLR